MNAEFAEVDSPTLLAADQRFEWWRAQHLRNGRPVLLKRWRNTPPTAAEISALKRECALAAELVSLAALLPRWNEPHAMLFEDPGGVLASQAIAASRLPIAQALAIAQQLAAALAELHGCGLVLRGLRPDAILCRPAEGRAWLIDFADAQPAGTLVAAPTTITRLIYVAPEQTGRLDAAVDARSDLYALGVVLYELLTGHAPHRAESALEQVHWHIAGSAREPSAVEPTIPPTLSALVMKLLAKNPDERFQSAQALAQDLATCAREWAAHGKITPFALGRRDLGEHLVISSRLVGREREVHRLLEAFERVGRGDRGGLVLVEGYSGIGKTALIQQLVKPFVRRRGLFISGKFDQVVRGLPFGALIQAFRGLVRHWLSESEAQLAVWRATLVQALGANGGVLAEVIPEIEYIIGPQAAPAALGSTEAQNRFQRVLQSFVTALAQAEHPLVLFLDDLQWADAATLDLLEPLLAGDPARHLLLIGAYRDNELDASPRLARTLTALASSGVELQRVSLGPLLPAELTQLVADTLRSDAAHAEPLARLVHRKTDGNPFFVIQFLKLLEAEGHLRFDEAALRWNYRIEQIADAPLADNVIDLMTRCIDRLPAPTRQALTMAACIGNRFDAATLAMVCEQPLAATVDALAPALDEGLVIDEAAHYAFLHDRVQQAAYASIPVDRRRVVHLAIGRLLQVRDATQPSQPAERSLFDTVHHLNLGRELIQDMQERRGVAALNLEAGRRAKSATAYDSALELFQAGVDLLGNRSWNGAHALAFDLHLEAAQGLYLCGQFEPALAAYSALLEHARTPIERARVTRLRSVQYENMARYADAIASTREGLALLGVMLPEDTGAQAVALQRETESIERLLHGREIASLIELPLMSDASMRMVMAMLTEIWSAAYIHGSGTLARLLSATMVRLSLEHGHVEESAYGYVTHAITVGPVMGDYAAAYELGRLALAVNQRLDDKRLRAKIYQQFHAHVNLWCAPLASCLPYAREACRSGLESGDFLYAAYGAGTEAWAAIACTEDLPQFVRDYEPSVALIRKLKNEGFADAVCVLINWARALQGQTASPLSLSDASLDEADYLERYAGNAFFTGIHAAMRLQLCLLLGSPQQALAAAEHAAPLVAQMPGVIWPVLVEFWHALALAANIGTLSTNAAARALLDNAAAAFETRAEHCADNFAPQAWLLQAEIARLDGCAQDAAALYEQAIEFTASRPLLPMQALAHELYGRFRLGRGQTHLARLHLAQARAGYARWGATAKLAAMQQQYPELLPRRDIATARTESAALPSALSSTSGDGLDLFSVLQSAQAIAGEVELGALLKQLLTIAIQNAGAERGALVLESEQGPQVHAWINDDGSDGGAQEGVALDHSAAVPVGLVNYVRRTGESLVLANAHSDEQHAAEPYVQQHQPRSVMGLPLQRSGRAIGVLYLEHRHVPGVFTAQRLNTLRVLAAQAAISLENARLFTAMKQEIGERQQAQAEVERLSRELEAENVYLRRDLIANVSHDLRTPLVSLRGYLEVLADKGQTLAPALRDEYLGIAVRQSEHLARLIDELFELAKLDFKGASLNREPFPLAELAADVAAKFALAAERQQITLRIDAPAGLPFVHADLGLIERVLDNLIGNALRHTPAGGRVSVILSADGDEVLTQVTDTGSGIASADLPFIFDRFYRGNHGQRQCGGAGLGLAITKRILDLHGARIDVQSDGACGTCFRFALHRSDMLA